MLHTTNTHVTYHKEHLPLVLVGQQEEAEHGGVGDLVVERLPVEVQEGGVDADIVPEVKIKSVHPSIYGTYTVYLCIHTLSSSIYIHIHLYRHTYHGNSCFDVSQKS